MRHASLLLLALLPAALRAGDEHPITSTIQHVTVFLTGAQVERTANADLPKGTTRLVFKQLSEEADPATVQVSGSGFTILSVKHRIDHGSTPEVPAAVKALETRIAAIERSIQDEQGRIGVLQNEEQRLLKNEAFEGGDQGLSVERIKAINDYFRERITAVREGVIAGQRRIADSTEAAQRLHLQVGQLQGRKPKAYSEVVVEVACDKAVHTALTLRYVVRSAGWSPQYDIRVSDVSHPLALTYKANVYQSTGEDWTDVQLDLASGDPQQSGVMPQLAVWRLAANTPPPGALRNTAAPYNAAVRDVRGILRDAATGEALPFANVSLSTADGTALNATTTDMDGYYALAVPPGARQITFNSIGYGAQRSDISSGTMNAALRQDQVQLLSAEVVAYKQPLIDKDDLAERTVSLRSARTSSSYSYIDGQQVAGGVPASYGDVTGGVVNMGPEVATRQSTTHFTFVIALPYSIPSDGQGHLVAVKEHEVPSVYRYYMVPKLDPSAYLFAKATGWDKLDLLPGPVNLYFEGTFIGESFLDADQVKDTLDISLGRDRALVVERVKEEQLNSRTFAGNKRVETIGWRIDVRNTKGTPVDLVITDQLPVAAMSDIEVEATEHSGGQVDEAHGFVTWRDHLPANGTAHHLFTYTVKAPKQLPLVLE